MIQDTALFVMSFDGGRDVWHPFFTLLFKFWPDCPFPIYLESNFLEYPDPRVRSLKIGKDTSFSESLCRSVAMIDASHILLLNDDYLLNAPADTAGVLAILEEMKRRDAEYFRLRASPPADQPLGRVSTYAYGRISPGQRFRTGFQASLWKKSLFAKVLGVPESPRFAEKHASERSWKLPGEFLAVTDETPIGPIPYFCTGVIHGYWVPAAVELCREHGIEVDLKQRKLQPLHHRLAHGNPIAGMIRKIQWSISERKRGVR